MTLPFISSLLSASGRELDSLSAPHGFEGSSLITVSSTRYP